MKPFHTITVPHKDILEGRLTMDIFAADLWEVFNKRGPDEYKDKDTFFAKTYLTDGLKNLLSCVERRLKQGAGDPVVQLQTPFGGGKTHALIAMFHKADEWGAKKAVIVGTALNPKDTLWGILEKQLKGKIEEFSDNITPGKEAIKRFLSEYQPLLILMDEVLEYATKSAGVKVGASNLASQTIAFMQELTEVVSTLKNTCLVITLPSSIIEHYDQSAERLFQQLQKVAGRMEKIYTPVQEYEITKIIRRRLFAQVKENEAKQVVSKFIDYAEKEQILPSGIEVSEYRKRFLDSYPFLPEVIEVLYHRWGSFPTFQRTRGVLRLLSLVIYSLKDSNLPYISLADFDLSNQEIRQELLKHIGQEFNSIISADITDKTSGAKKVDSGLGDAYKGLNLGTRTSTTIFMYSFSGGVERGATIGEIKRTATVLDIPSSIVAESIENLRNKLFYLQTSQDKYFFSNQPNLNRILLTKTENIKDREPSSLSYLHAVCSTPDMRSIYLKGGDEWVEEKLRLVENDLLIPIPSVTDVEYEWFLSDFKTALLLEDWINEVPLAEISNKYGVGPGDIHVLIETAEWLVYAMRELARVYRFASVPELTDLIMRVKYGCKKELLNLVSLKDVGRVRARSLYNAGFKTISSLRGVPIERLAKIPNIGRKVAMSIKRQIGDIK